MKKRSIPSWLVAAYAVLAFCSFTASAQTIGVKGVMICLHDFKIGDSRSEALGAIERGGCSATPQNSAALGDTSYLITAKGDSVTDYGVLEFKADHISSIEKFWDVGVHDEATFAEAFYGLLSKTEADGKTACHLVTSHTNDPTLSSESATFKCGNVLVGFEIMTAYGSKQIRIIEIVR